MKTRLTERLDIVHPLIQAPMAFAAGGALAKAVSDAGALGMIGGGYGDAAWIDEQFAIANGSRVGCGFITWALARQPELLDQALELGAAAIFLSFGDPATFSEKVRKAGVMGAVAKHIFLVTDPTKLESTIRTAFEIARTGSAAALCAAGGIADGRGLAASLMLGADGVVVGTRFWATAEALAHRKIMAAAIGADGDATLRTRVVDIARKIEWSERYTGRVLSNEFVQRWHGREDQLQAVIEHEVASWAHAQESGDATIAAPFVGEAIGLVHDTDIVKSLIVRAKQLLTRFDNLEV